MAMCTIKDSLTPNSVRNDPRRNFGANEHELQVAIKHARRPSGLHNEECRFQTQLEHVSLGLRQESIQ